MNARFPTSSDPEIQRLVTSLYDFARDLDLQMAQQRQQGANFVSEPLAATTGAGNCLAWRNPFDQRIVITRVIVDQQQLAAGATMDVGTSAVANASSNNLIDTLNISSVNGAYGNISYAGVNGKDCQRLGVGEYITFTISGVPLGFKGNAYIEYYFCSPIL